jgi:hypothetical protein
MVHGFRPALVLHDDTKAGRMQENDFVPARATPRLKRAPIAPSALEPTNANAPTAAARRFFSA